MRAAARARLPRLRRRRRRTRADGGAAAGWCSASASSCSASRVVFVAIVAADRARSASSSCSLRRPHHSGRGRRRHRARASSSSGSSPSCSAPLKPSWRPRRASPGAPLLGVVFARRLDAVPRPDARGDHALALGGGSPGRAACSASSTRSASASRSCSSRSASAGSAVGRLGQAAHPRHQHRRRRAARRHRRAHGHRRLGDGSCVMLQGGDRLANPSTRPSDHIDSAPRHAAAISQPKLGFVGYLRFFWRQLTSMRTALFLLLLLAIAAIPGSLVPQRQLRPERRHPVPAPTPRALRRCSTCSRCSTSTRSVWFSAIYLLLFISLIGCVIPRTKHHFDGAAGAPAEDPGRGSQRLAGFTDDARPTVDADGRRSPRRAPCCAVSGYRAERYGSIDLAPSAATCARPATWSSTPRSSACSSPSASAAASATPGSGSSSRARRSSTCSATTTRSTPAGSSASAALAPYRITLDELHRRRTSSRTSPRLGQRDRLHGARHDDACRASEPQQARSRSTSRSRSAAPRSTCSATATRRSSPCATPTARSSRQTRCRSCRRTPTSPRVGVIKVAGRRPAEQLGMVGFFYPTAAELPTAVRSPRPTRTSATRCSPCSVYAGDLGLDDGVPKSVYELDTDDLTQIAGGRHGVAALQLGPGETVDLPNGLGTIELTERAALRVARHPPRPVAGRGCSASRCSCSRGLSAALFIPRRRRLGQGDPGRGWQHRHRVRGTRPRRGPDPASRRRRSRHGSTTEAAEA